MEESESLKLARPLLGKMVTVTMDRPLGSKHPKYGFEYSVNYGYVEGVLAPDGDDLDPYVLGVMEPLETFTGLCIAIVHRPDDDDDKLVIVPESHKDITDEEILTQTHFQEWFFKSVVVRG